MADNIMEQNVFLYSGKRIEISGVTDVFELTDSSVELTLEEGCLGIDGEDLRIEYFSADTNKACIIGTVRGLQYYSKPLASKKKKKSRS